MSKTAELEHKMQEAIDFSYDYYKKHGNFPKTSEDPFYRSAVRYFSSARNYRKQVLVHNGYTETEAEHELNKNPISKQDLFNAALDLFKTKGKLWAGSDLVEDYFGCLFYIRKEVLESLGYSREDILYMIKEQTLQSATPLEEVLKPLEDYIRETGEFPRSYEFKDRGTIVRRFNRWEIALDVASEHIKDPSKSVDALYKSYRDPYFPDIRILDPVKTYIRSNKKLPKTGDIKNYHKIVREYILWDNALDEAMSDLGFDIEKRRDYFRKR